jgi:hypothetical protein
MPSISFALSLYLAFETGLILTRFYGASSVRAALTAVAIPDYDRYSNHHSFRHQWNNLNPLFLKIVVLKSLDILGLLHVRTSNPTLGKVERREALPAES